MLLTVNELSVQLNIKPSTLYLWVKQDKIPYQKIHTRVRFDPDEIQRWRDSFAKKPSSPVSHMPDRHPNTPVDDLIARAKRDVYTSSHGETITPSPTGKE